MPDQEIIVIDNETPLTSLFADVHAFWSSKKNDDRLPRISDFRLDELPTKILPWSIVADVINEDKSISYKFRFWGTQRASLIGYDMTGRFLSDISSDDMREGNLTEYEYVRAQKKPILCQTPIVTSTGRPIAMSSIRLPLSNDGINVTRVFSALDPEHVTSDHYAHFGTDPSRM
jgi:hypothetical protein